MALFTRDSIDRLRDAIDMVDLVGTKTDLRRVGSRWTGLCPFHDERSPSFSVNAEEKLFYCFGCHAKGDAFSFVEQSEGLDFREAVELLGDRYGDLLREVLLGVAGGRARPRLPDRSRPGGGGAARVPGRVRAQRLGPRDRRRAA
jgi:DNA primase